MMPVIRGVPYRILAWPQVSVPLISRPVARYRRGGTTPMWTLGKHIYMSVLFIVVAVCLLLLFVVFFVIIIILYISSLELHVGCTYKFSLSMYMNNHVYRNTFQI